MAHELTDQVGSANLPVTCVGGRYLTGFDPGQLTALLSRLGQPGRGRVDQTTRGHGG